MKNLKFLFLLVAIFGLSFSESYSDDDLNGKIYQGKATELVSPDLDRRPMILDETMSFQNGKIVSDMLKKYSVNECDYYSEVDGRRAIAFTVIAFNFSCEGEFNERKATIEFTGDVIGYERLIGTMIIRYSDNSEERYSIQAESK